MESEKLEYINSERLRIVNGPEYNLGRRTQITKNLLKKGKFIELFKIINRHFKINKLSISNEPYSLKVVNKVNYNKPKVAVYTCVTGGYDNVPEPIFTADNLDYILFTDNKNNKVKDSKWTTIDISKMNELKELSLAEKNRFIKLNPNKVIDHKYDYSIYIDGNIEVVGDIRKLITGISDKYGMAMHLHRNRDSIYKEVEVCKLVRKGNYSLLKEQTDKYKSEGFPESYGMLEANVIAIDLNNKIAKKIMENWWNEFITSKSGRDQISLPYVLWKNDIKIRDLASLGSDVYKNPIIFIKEHNEMIKYDSY